MKAMLIDLTKCVGCYNCQIVCKDEHVGNEWLPYARSQPIAGQFWMKMYEEEWGTTPKVRVVYTPVPCQHCANAPCIKSCAVGAIYTRDDGLVVIDPEKCTGCMSCVAACPYGAIYFNNELMIAQKCTGCAHLLDQYGWSVPRCVDACVADAISFGEESELGEKYANAETLHPEYGLETRVRYIGLHKPRIGGTIYDPVKKEVIIGATCVLTDQAGGSPVTVTTDEFGDFYFNELKQGTYALKIEAQGFPGKQIDAIDVVKDVNLGDIPLE